MAEYMIWNTPQFAWVYGAVTRLSCARSRGSWYFQLFKRTTPEVVYVEGSKLRQVWCPILRTYILVNQVFLTLKKVSKGQVQHAFLIQSCLKQNM